MAILFSCTKLNEDSPNNDPSQEDNPGTEKITISVTNIEASSASLLITTGSSDTYYLGMSDKDTLELKRGRCHLEYIYWLFETARDSVPDSSHRKFQFPNYRSWCSDGVCNLCRLLRQKWNKKWRSLHLFLCDKRIRPQYPWQYIFRHRCSFVSWTKLQDSSILSKKWCFIG